MVEMTKIEKEARDAYERWKDIEIVDDVNAYNANDRFYDFRSFKRAFVDYIEQDSDFAFLGGDRELIGTIVDVTLSIMSVERFAGDGSFESFSKMALVMANNLRDLPLFWKAEEAFYKGEDVWT